MTGRPRGPGTGRWTSARAPPGGRAHTNYRINLLMTHKLLLTFPLRLLPFFEKKIRFSESASLRTELGAPGPPHTCSVLFSVVIDFFESLCYGLVCPLALRDLRPNILTLQFIFWNMIKGAQFSSPRRRRRKKIALFGLKKKAKRLVKRFDLESSRLIS